MKSRKQALRIAAGILALGLAGLGWHAAAQPAEQVVKIVAKKFMYTPNEIRLKKGVPVVLELTSEDVIMGFKSPDLAAVAEIVPGKITHVRITPDKVGTFTFYCNVFCGDGHEDMDGTIIVEE
jgi:cytochrome c oxidase subunit II